jgi:uncharacterized cysteine cluster protein YcgN (CxxCxxCC family)
MPLDDCDGKAQRRLATLTPGGLMPPPSSRSKPAASGRKQFAANPQGTAKLADEPPFWKQKSLEELNPAEWESLCDGCGRCCLVKLEDEESGQIHFTDVACKLFNPSTCRCADYAHRRRRVHDCIKLTPDKVRTLGWLPPSCAYRLIAEGRDLAWWHPLVSGSQASVHEAGVSVRGRVEMSETEIHLADYPDHIVAWPGKKPRLAQPNSAFAPPRKALNPPA